MRKCSTAGSTAPGMCNDKFKTELVSGFTRDTFTAMIEGVRDAALAAEIIDAAKFDAGIRDLYRTAEADGVFCYTFFKATAFKATAVKR